MIFLRETPFSLAYQTIVRAKLQAHNERGWSDEGPIGTGP